MDTTTSTRSDTPTPQITTTTTTTTSSISSSRLPIKKPFDVDGDLELFFDSVVNGDIYDKASGELICTSGQQHIVVRGAGNIHEKVVESFPCYDGTLIRAFQYEGVWRLATRKKINAFESRWNQTKSFGELFEEISKTKVEYLFYSLNPNFAYSFLLLTPAVTNVLFNRIAEVIFVSAYDRKKKIWEQIQGETFKTLVLQRPAFSNRIVKSDNLPHFDKENSPPKNNVEKIEKENDLIEKTFKTPQRNQRGLLFVGKSGRLYRQDFQKYRNWQRIISERPLHIVFFEQMKKFVKRDSGCVISEFYQNYPLFSVKGALFEMVVRVIKYQFQSNLGLPKPIPAHFQNLFESVYSRNKIPIPSLDFIRRTVAFQKYTLLTEIFFEEGGEEIRNFVYAHRNLYTNFEQHPPTRFHEPSHHIIGKGIDEEGIEDDDDGVFIGRDEVNEGSEEGGGPDVSAGGVWNSGPDDELD